MVNGLGDEIEIGISREPTPEMLAELKPSLTAELERRVQQRRKPELVKDWDGAVDYWGFWTHNPDLDYSLRSIFFLKIDQRLEREDRMEIHGNFLDNLGVARFDGEIHNDMGLVFVKKYNLELALPPATEKPIMYIGKKIPDSNDYNGQWNILPNSGSGDSGNFRMERPTDSKVLRFVKEKMAYDLAIALRR